MRKHILTLTLALTGLLTGNLNAGGYDDCCQPQSCFDGMYAGANLGVISHTAHRNDLDGFLTDNSGWTNIDTAFTGGLQVGYNKVCDSAIFGFIADFDGATISHKMRDEPNDEGDDNYIKHDVRWYSTMRAKAGLTLCNAQLYITGGAAVAKFKTSWRDDEEGKSFNKCRWGWVVGMGAEYCLCDNITMGAEALYLTFDRTNRSLVSDSESRYTFAHSDSLLTARFFVNYYFDDLFSCCR
ncbi:MAG: porin family protein [Chlamydiia bacterium]|nr:porin family protein [Chlamydiia bacterium]